MHFLYTRFTTVAGQLSPLLREFEHRSRTHPEELGALLSECHTAYFSARETMPVSRLTEQIRGLDPTRTEFVKWFVFGGSVRKSLNRTGHLSALGKSNLSAYTPFLSRLGLIAHL